jgi:hypothetical protein
MLDAVNGELVHAAPGLDVDAVHPVFEQGQPVRGELPSESAGEAVVELRSIRSPESADLAAERRDPVRCNVYRGQ